VILVSFVFSVFSWYLDYPRILRGEDTTVRDEIDAMVEEYEAARREWVEAMTAHVTAQPDLGFSLRLAATATAAARRAATSERARAAGLEWDPVLSQAEVPHELRPGSGRRGPPELWERVDQAVEEVELVASGRSLRAVAQAYAELAHAAQELANAVAEEDGLMPATPVRARKASAS
jgi:hypothetical protein